MSQINFFIAFLAGSVSFFAPCVIPLVPAFLSYLAGQTLDKTSRLVVFGHSILFVLGFSTIFAILGVLLNSVLASIAYTTQIWLGRIAGTIIIFFGLYLLGLIKPKFLEKEYKIRAHKFNSKALTSFMFGAAFAVGWTPCIGAVLGSILALAASMPGESFILLMGYSLGLGAPFLIAGIFAQEFFKIIKKYTSFLKYFNIVVGALIIILGVLVFTGRLSEIASSFSFLNGALLK